VYVYTKSRKYQSEIGVTCWKLVTFDLDLESYFCIFHLPYRPYPSLAVLNALTQQLHFWRESTFLEYLGHLGYGVNSKSRKQQSGHVLVGAPLGHSLLLLLLI